MAVAIDHRPDRRPDRQQSITEPATDRPYLRAWLHAGGVPLAALLGIVLVPAAPTAQLRLALAVFAVTACALFATSAAFHRGSWSPSMHGVLMRADYANIHLWIAASTTALAVALSEVRLDLPPEGNPLVPLTPVWAAALAGAVATIVRPVTSRWWRIGGYVVVGNLAAVSLVGFAPALEGSVAALILAGGAAYALGGMVYGFRFPNPSPRWFGYHEVFHALTVLGFGAHAAAVWLAIAGGAV